MIKNLNFDPNTIGITNNNILWNLSPAALIEAAIKADQAKLTSSGALAVDTGKFTGRSPKDRFIVLDDKTRDKVDWNGTNIGMSPEHFDKLYHKVLAHLNQCEQLYIRDAYACAHQRYRLKLRVVCEFPWQNLFAYNMFLRPEKAEILEFLHDWVVYAAPGCLADPTTDGTRQENFAAINFTKKTIIIGGTAYTGEIKKGIFSVLNFLLPTENGVFPMHCSANVGKQGDTALFFGLSGTGKTTLSTDSERKLIGDDEHGWSQANVFNFEGGCYAKTINLSEAKEPEIYKAIKFGAMVENVGFKDEQLRIVDYDDDSKTENTRVSYPIDYIDNIVFNSRGNVPENIFFLTCDAFGVLPPISKLTKEQAMYYFLLGYTAKIAGTEAGITEPQATFSACFGLPFLPLKPTDYSKLLGTKLDEGNKDLKTPIHVWLVNTGWSGGPYGVGSRMDLTYTRAMIRGALNDTILDQPFVTEAHFGLSIPTAVKDVPTRILNPRDTWESKTQYDTKAEELKGMFKKNFARYLDHVTEEVANSIG
jgi:phosphoenolpyruvate carboxykinase (ATP)